MKTKNINVLAILGMCLSLNAYATPFNSTQNQQQLALSSMHKVQTECIIIDNKENIDPSRKQNAQSIEREGISTLQGLKQVKLSDDFHLVNHLIHTSSVEDKVLYNLVSSKISYTEEDIRAEVQKQCYDKEKETAIVNEVLVRSRSIGVNKYHEPLYWSKRYEHNYGRNFFAPIIYSSVNKDWKSAVKEWTVVGYEEVVADTCICGKEEIIHVFTIRNKNNGNLLFPIGSKCIEKFKSKRMTKQSREYEARYKEMRKLQGAVEKGEDITLNSKWFSRKLLLFWYNNGILQNDDYSFIRKMFDKRRKDFITDQQQNRISRIIETVIIPHVRDFMNNPRIRKIN